MSNNSNGYWIYHSLKNLNSIPDKIRGVFKAAEQMQNVQVSTTVKDIRRSAAISQLYIVEAQKRR
jgi:hypothetical protein